MLLCCQRFLDNVFLHLMSTKCPSVSPASGEEKEAMTLEMKPQDNCPAVG